MGLEKTVLQSTGVKAVYWKLHDINICRADKQIRCTYFGFIDKEASDSGLKHVGRIETVVELTEPLAAEKDLIGDMYVEAKKSAEWAEAKDVLEE